MVVMMSEYMAAARSPPQSEPQNIQARRSGATPRSAHSAVLFKSMLFLAPLSGKKLREAVVSACAHRAYGH